MVGRIPYVNQVGVLREQASTEIPIRHLCYYVIHRYIERKKVNEISKDLVSGDFPLTNDLRVLGEDCRKYFAGLVFGVAPELGIQLLLIPEIKASLSNQNESQINNLIETHGSIIKSLLQHIIDQESDFPSLFSYGHIMYQEISNNPEFIQCKNRYLSKIATYFPGQISSISVSEVDARNLSGIFQMFSHEKRKVYWVKKSDN